MTRLQTINNNNKHNNNNNNNNNNKLGNLVILDIWHIHALLKIDRIDRNTKTK